MSNYAVDFAYYIQNTNADRGSAGYNNLRNKLRLILSQRFPGATLGPIEFSEHGAGFYVEGRINLSDPLPPPGEPSHYAGLFSWLTSDADEWTPATSLSQKIRDCINDAIQALGWVGHAAGARRGSAVTVRPADAVRANAPPDGPVSLFNVRHNTATVHSEDPARDGTIVAGNTAREVSSAIAGALPPGYTWIFVAGGVVIVAAAVLYVATRKAVT